MPCECAGCTEHGCNYFTVHRWNGDFDFKSWDITTGNAWRDYLTDNQPQNTSLLWRLRYDGEPYDDFMRQLYPRSAFHQWEDTWRVVAIGPVRDNLLCSPWWGVRLHPDWLDGNAAMRSLLYFTLVSGSGNSVDEFYWHGEYGDPLPFALDVGCLRCAAHGNENYLSNWPNPPGYWHDFTLDYAGSIPDVFQLPTEQDVINWIAAKQISDQAAYPGQYLPDVLPSTWRERLRPNESNIYDPSGNTARLITQAALWAGDRLRQNPSVGCVPGIILWSNTRGGHGAYSPTEMDEDSNYGLLDGDGRSVAWWEGWAITGGEYTQHTTYVTLSDETPAIMLAGARNVDAHSSTSLKPAVAVAEWVTPITDWLATGNKYLILDNPACNWLSLPATGYPDPEAMFWSGTYATTFSGSTSDHAAAANAMLSALGCSIRFGDLISMNQHGRFDDVDQPTTPWPFYDSGIDLTAVGGDPLIAGFSDQTIAPVGFSRDSNSMWAWNLTGATPLVQATRRMTTSSGDLVGYDEVWTAVAVERLGNGSVILVGGWEESHAGYGAFRSSMQSTIWDNLVAELP